MGRGYGCAVLFRIFGRVAVVGDDGDEIAIGARRQRALLARLILDANRVVAPSVLVESVWGDELPVHPEAALQVVVSRLRTGLGSCGRRIVADASGYRLEADSEEIDVLWAESLLRTDALRSRATKVARAPSCSNGRSHCGTETRSRAWKSSRSRWKPRTGCISCA